MLKISQKSLIISLVIYFWWTPLYSVNSVKDEVFLHPADAFTGFTLNRNDFIYNLPVLSISPGWFWWGITDWITAEIDVEANLGGVPSVNFRIKLLKTEKYNLAVETMFQYVPKSIELDYFKEDDGTDLSIKRWGSSWYNNLNLSVGPFKHSYIHLSGGVAYQKHLEILNRSDSTGISFDNFLFPHLSVGLDSRISSQVALLFSASYGLTFTYLDNVPRKLQAVVAIRWAPLPNNRVGLLRNMRTEISCIYMCFPDVDKSLFTPMAYLYWQW
ncbi:MAG: hypothetical protein APR63_10515 [Desulfuromonas sp. SDB]|nr:MAG: hypothetical protein APR63_10515 [Desulfuromonas sp. SDB]